MEYSEYVKFLNNKNIILFDHDYRISYHNIFKRLPLQQTGGGNNILENKSIDEIKTIVNVATSSNHQYVYSLL